MELNEYQKKALETAVYDDTNPVAYCILGMAGEAGEVANKYKKVLRGDKELDENLKYEIAKEIGDVQWYIAALSHLIGYSLDSICDINLTKLNQRREDGTIKGDGDNR